MASWRFAESDEDGDAWMKSPGQLYAFVDLQAATGPRRIMVVTKSWMENQLAAVRGQRGRAVFPSVLVVPDGSPAALRAAIDAAVSAGGLAEFATTPE